MKCQDNNISVQEILVNERRDQKAERFNSTRIFIELQ